MTTSVLTTALRAGADHVSCFARDGTERYWSEIVAAASSLAARMAAESGSRWAVNVDDTFLFAGALLGLWGAGKTPVLAPRPLIESADSHLSFDGIVEAAGEDAGTSQYRRRVSLEGLPPAPRRLDAIHSSVQIVLYTSGSTGRPKEVRRALWNLEAEIEVFESLWGKDLGHCRTFSTVSHRHVYGLLFRLLWPLLTKRPFAAFDLEYPEQLVDERLEGELLISSPALLKRVGHFPDASARWRAVYSSGGLLPGPAAAESARVLGTCPVEVLGSTETSGVAWRRQDAVDAAAWRPLPGVEIRLSEEEHLEVRSPFVGDAEWLRMGDLARLSGDGTFDLLGRGDHVAKIEDKRISLAEIERLLIDTAWVEDAAALALEDDARQYVGVLVRLSGTGADEFVRVGRDALSRLIREALRGRIETVALPRKIRYVEEIPVDAQGKRHEARLKKLFASL